MRIKSKINIGHCDLFRDSVILPYVFKLIWFTCTNITIGERDGLVVESLTPEREVGGSIPTSAVLCP